MCFFIIHALLNSSFIMGGLHLSIYSEITMQFAAEDSSLVAIMETLQPLQLSDFGVQELFLIDDSLLLEPVDHIATLGSFPSDIFLFFSLSLSPSPGSSLLLLLLLFLSSFIPR